MNQSFVPCVQGIDIYHLISLHKLAKNPVQTEATASQLVKTLVNSTTSKRNSHKNLPAAACAALITSLAPVSRDYSTRKSTKVDRTDANAINKRFKCKCVAK